ncbi:MAG: hypothetical protein JXD21_05745 [Candidatus Omnitrophica bacterium]|nr:hypothetical protein [Candidatus Omnitrophota bacterium]
MLKKVISTILIFLFCLGYLHQKIALSVEAYRLTDHYRKYRQLVDKRDVLLYNLSEKTSLAEINVWARHHQFEFAPSEKVIALRMNTEPQRSTHQGVDTIMQLATRLFKVPGESEVLAKEKTKKGLPQNASVPDYSD